MGSPECATVLGVCHLVFKATRYVTDHFLKTSAELLTATENYCMDMQCDRSSVAIVARQFLSLLASGDVDAVVGPLRPRAFASMADLVTADPAAASTSRCAVYAASAYINGSFVENRSEGVHRLLMLVISGQRMATVTCESFSRSSGIDDRGIDDRSMANRTNNFKKFRNR